MTESNEDWEKRQEQKRLAEQQKASEELQKLFPNRKKQDKHVGEEIIGVVLISAVIVVLLWVFGAFSPRDARTESQKWEDSQEKLIEEQMEYHGDNFGD